MSSEDGGGRDAVSMDFNQRDENVSFYPHNHQLDPTLTESQKDFLKFEK